MATIQRAAPIFGVRDVDAALAHYAQLGFATRRYPLAEYGFISRDGIEFHLGGMSEPFATSSAYIWVDDSDALAREWQAAGGDVRMPEDTEWGQHEGVLIDLDGNIIRFGTPLT